MVKQVVVVVNNNNGNNNNIINIIYNDNNKIIIIIIIINNKDFKTKPVPVPWLGSKYSTAEHFVPTTKQFLYL